MISNSSCCFHDPPAQFRGAKMASQGAPEVGKWFPGMSTWAQMADPRSQKGPAAEGVAREGYEEGRGGSWIVLIGFGSCLVDRAYMTCPPQPVPTPPALGL